MSELLPCPFCGGEADISDEGIGTEPERFWAYCMNGRCFMEGTNAFETEEGAIAAWNTRVERTRHDKDVLIQVYAETIAELGQLCRDLYNLLAMSAELPATVNDLSITRRRMEALGLLEGE